MTISSRLYKNLGLSVVSLALTLSIIEMGLRIFYHYHPREFDRADQRSPKPDYTLELVSSDGATITGPGWVKLAFHPYLIFKTAPDQHNALFNVNSMGFRGGEVSAEKESDVFRIIVLGGSATFGIGASSDAGTLSYQLERKLNDGYSFSKRVEVINAGVIGYLSTQDLLYLESELIDLSPDLIIAYDGYNDFYTTVFATQGCSNPLEKPEEIGYHVTFKEIEGLLIRHALERESGFLSQVSDLLKSQARKMALGKFLRDRFRPLRRWLAQTNRPDATLSERESQKWDSYEINATCMQYIIDKYKRNLAQMARFLGAYDVSLLLAVQPELGWKMPWSNEETQADRDFVRLYPWYRRAAQIIYPQLVQAAADVAAEQGVPFVDLRAAFQDRLETIFIDPVHINDRGNEIVAQALSDYLREKKLNVDRKKNLE